MPEQPRDFQPTWKLPDGIEDDLTMGELFVVAVGCGREDGFGVGCRLARTARLSLTIRL